MMHEEKSPLAGQTVIVKCQDNLLGGEFIVEDWWDRLLGKSWTQCPSNIVAINYTLRVHRLKLPKDDEVLYGKIGHLGYLVHMSEVKKEVT